jgi:hypothetical protein
MADGRVAGRHRLTVEPNDLPQPARDPRLRVRERDALSLNPTGPTADPALRIEHGDPTRGPRQVIPRPQFDVAYLPCPSPTPGTFVAADAPTLEPDQQSSSRSVRRPVDVFDPIPLQSQNPSTLAMRSHASSLVVGTSREDTIENLDGEWDRVANRSF